MSCGPSSAVTLLVDVNAPTQSGNQAPSKGQPCAAPHASLPGNSMTEQDFRRNTATVFYRTYCPHRMGEIDYINLDYPVRDVRIEKGMELWGFKDLRVSPLKTTFFCIPGHLSQYLAYTELGLSKQIRQQREKY